MSDWLGFIVGCVVWFDCCFVVLIDYRLGLGCFLSFGFDFGFWFAVDCCFGLGVLLGC